MRDLDPDQWTGAEFLAARPVAYLADKMGFGKTAQAIRACEMVGATRVTAVVPPHLRINMASEWREWSLFGMPTTIINSSDDEIPSEGLVIVPTSLVHKEKLRKRLRTRHTHATLIDEAHCLKEPFSRRTKATIGGGGMIGVTNMSDRVWWLSGTPTPNGAHEWYTFLRFCGAWTGDRDAFTKEFCIYREDQYGVHPLGNRPDKVETLKAMLRPYVLQREKVDPDRPGLFVDHVAVEGRVPNLEAAGLTLDDIAKIETAAIAGDWSLENEPFVATARRLIGAAKAEGVAQMAAYDLEDSGEKLLIFGVHTATINEIARRLSKYNLAIIDGKTPTKVKDAALHEFQHGQGLRILIGQMQAMSEGLTLTAASRVIMAESAWTPAQNAQAIARAWRRGQRNPVIAKFAVLPGSIDDVVTRTVARKTNDIMALQL